MTTNASSNGWKEGQKFIININDFRTEFEIIKKISSGGFGEIWLIRGLDTFLAVKNSLFKELEDLQKYGRYYIPREARALLTLDFHPHVITCLMVKRIYDTPRLVMEFADKGSLYDLMIKEKLSMKDILNISIQICSGLSHAHNYNNGLIHRDLKPQNILLSSIDAGSINYPFNYVAKVADFNLVKELLNEKSPINNDPLNSGYGTWGYMSPEQYGGFFEKLDKDTDVFSFGVMLCEMITGKRPFDSENIVSFVTRQQEINNHIIEHFKKYAQNCPEDLVSLIINCVQFNPFNRWKKEKENNSYFYFSTIKDHLIKLYKKLFYEEYPVLQFNSNKSGMSLMRGLNLSEFRQYNLSLKCYNKFIEFEPQNPAGYHNRSVDLRELRRFDEALESIDMALRLETNNPDAYIVRANILCDLQRYDESIKECDKAISLDKSAKRAYNNKARALVGKGEHFDALENVKIALDIDSTYIKPYIIKGVILNKLKRYEESEKTFDEALKIDPMNFDIYISRAIMYETEGKYDEAKIWYEKALKIYPDSNEIYFKIARIFHEQKNYSDAIRYYDEYLERETSMDIKYLRALCMKNLNFDEALNSLKEIIDFDPHFSSAYYELGLLHYQDKKFSDAIGYYTQFLTIEKNSAKGHNNLGVSLQQIGQWEEALKEFESALLIDQEYALSWNGKGSCLNYLERYDEALYCCEMAVKIDPQYVNGWTNMGGVLINLERYDEAMCCIDESLRLNPNSIDGLAWKGYSLEMLSRTKESLKIYQTVLSIDPNNQIAIDGRQRLVQHHE